MSISAPDLTRPDPLADAPNDDTIVVTCGACDRRQHAPGRAMGFTCEACGTEWQVLRCRECRTASIVRAGDRTCPRCEHQHAAVRGGTVRPEAGSWLTEPEPLSVWLGGVKYLGGHAARDQTVASSGLLLDRRGIHLRAFAELFSMRWETVMGLDIEGPLEIADRLSMTRLLALGASTWAMQVSYLTVRTRHGDAIFEIAGLAPPELHARLSRVLQGLPRSQSGAIAIERPTPTTSAPAPRPAAALEPAPAPAPAREPAAPTPLTVDPERSDAPLEAIVIDALWKLGQLLEQGLVTQADGAILRDRLLARVPALGAPSPPASSTPAPLLRV